MLLAFDDVGPGPVVVLLHGFPLDRWMWTHQKASIGAIYRLIVPDLRGHGSSAAPDGIYTVDGMADDVLELLDALQLTGPVVFGGLSMGGYIALSIAARHPDRVKALMLMNTRAAADSPEAAGARQELAAEVEAHGPGRAGGRDHAPQALRAIHRRAPPRTGRPDARPDGEDPRPGGRRDPARPGDPARPDRRPRGHPRAHPHHRGGRGPGDPARRIRGHGPADRRREARHHPRRRPRRALENHHATDAAILEFLQSLWT